jgi:hypothetical protein
MTSESTEDVLVNIVACSCSATNNLRVLDHLH